MSNDPRSEKKKKPPCNKEWTCDGLTVKCMRPKGHDDDPAQIAHQCHGLPDNATIIWAQRFNGASTHREDRDQA